MAATVAGALSRTPALPPGAAITVVAGLAESLISFRRHLLASLVQLGYRVTACAPPPTEAGIVPALHAMGVEFVPVRMARTGMNPFSDLVCTADLYRLMRARKPALVIGYTIKPVIYGTLAACLAGIPHRAAMITGLGYTFTSGERQGRRRWLRALVTRLYQRALARNQHVFFQNPDDLGYFVDHGILDDAGKASITAGSGIDVERFAPVPLPEQPVFLLIARYLADKGVREFVAAARIVKASLPQARFRMVGWIDRNPSAIAAAELEAWRREGIIENLGRLDEDGVREAIAGCSVYVLPSYREGTPRTVLEAMAMARPIITTDVPGCRETTRHGVNGYLVPARSVEPLAARMLELAQAPELAARMGQASRRIAVEKYDVRKVTQRMLHTLGLIDAAANAPAAPVAAA